MKREQLIQLRWLLKQWMEQEYSETMYWNENNFITAEIDYIDSKIKKLEEGE